jgi:hypothetical protein
MSVLERRVVIATADWDSENPGDLRFERGDEIEVMGTQTGAWWQGQRDDQAGLFPVAYVMDPNGEREPDIVDQVFLVARGFLPRTPNELELIEGDLVDVEVVLRGEVCRGTRLRDGARGTFPLTILEIS